MKLVTISQSVKSLSNEALAALAAGKPATREGVARALDALAAGKAGGYSVAAEREAARRARKRARRISRPAAA